jgi:hypothetical protein
LISGYTIYIMEPIVGDVWDKIVNQLSLQVLAAASCCRVWQIIFKQRLQLLEHVSSNKVKEYAHRCPKLRAATITYDGYTRNTLFGLMHSGFYNQIKKLTIIIQYEYDALTFDNVTSFNKLTIRCMMLRPIRLPNTCTIDHIKIIGAAIKLVNFTAFGYAHKSVTFDRCMFDHSIMLLGLGYFLPLKIKIKNCTYFDDDQSVLPIAMDDMEYIQINLW